MGTFIFVGVLSAPGVRAAALDEYEYSLIEDGTSWGTGPEKCVSQQEQANRIATESCKLDRPTPTSCPRFVYLGFVFHPRRSDGAQPGCLGTRVDSFYGDRTGAGGALRFRVKALCDCKDLTTLACIPCPQPQKAIPDRDFCPRPIDGISTDGPIIPATGEKIKDEIDFVDSGQHPLTFTRFYGSNRAKRSAPAPAGTAPNSLWHHTFETRLQISTPVVTLTFGSGNTRVFSNPGGNVVAPALTSSRWPNDQGLGELVAQPVRRNGFSSTEWYHSNPEDDSTWVFNAVGLPITHIQRNGWAMNYAHNAAGQLVSVSNAFGKTLGFSYNPQGQLTQVTMPDGSAASYAYDNSGRLSSSAFLGAAGKEYGVKNMGSGLLI